MKLITLLIDGVSSDYISTCLTRLPNLTKLASRGLLVTGLRPEVCARSIPGRVSILTGAKPTESGVYGTEIWNGSCFRAAGPNDVRVPTLARLTREAGAKVAVVGFGLVKPEDADIFHHPWWVGRVLRREPRQGTVGQDSGWSRAAGHHDHVFEAMTFQNYPNDYPVVQNAPWRNDFITDLMSDQYNALWTSLLATSDKAPDLILTEFLSTDGIQHRTGYKSDVAHWGVVYADALVGQLVTALEIAGMEDRYALAILSDHGHHPVEKAIHFDVILPDGHYRSEGAMLHTVPSSKTELARVTDVLAEHGAVLYSGNHLPVEHRDRVFAFLAPDATIFEPSPPNQPRVPIGPATLMSDHSLCPGHRGDDRFALFVGSDVPQGRLYEAEASQIAPTLARILGLPSAHFQAEALY